MATAPTAGIATGDRALYFGVGQRRGKQSDVLAVFGQGRSFCSIRFDDGVAMLARAQDMHPVPRRPPPDF